MFGLARVVAVVAPVVPDRERDVVGDVGAQHLGQELGLAVFAGGLVGAEGGPGRRISPLAADDRDRLAGGGEAVDECAQLAVVVGGGGGRLLAVGVDADGAPVVEQSGAEAGLEEGEVDGGGGRAEEGLGGGGVVDGGAGGGGERGVVGGVRPGFPEPLDVRLVPDLPQEALAGVARHGGRGPAGVGGAEPGGAGAAGQRVAVAGVGVVRVAVVEDEQRAQAVALERRHQPVVGAEVVLARLALGARPRQVHPHPAEAGVADHRQLARLRVGEVDVHPEAVRRTGGRQRRVRRRRGGGGDR